MKKTQFDVVMARIDSLEEKLDLFLERKTATELVDDGADAFELVMSQYEPRPATGTIGVLNG